MDDKELEKELKEQVNEIMDEENTQIPSVDNAEQIVEDIQNNRYADIKFEEIEKQLDKKNRELDFYKKISEGKIELSSDKKKLQALEDFKEADANSYKELLEKIYELFDEKIDIYNESIDNFDISNINEEELELFNKNVRALSEFYQNVGAVSHEYNEYDIQAIKDDINEYNNFSEIAKNIEYVDLEQNYDNMLLLMEKHPYNEKVKDLANIVYKQSKRLLNEKFEDLKNYREKMNITKEEEYIYDTSKSDEEYAQRMMENDPEVLKFNKELEEITQEINELKISLATLKDDAPEYKQYKQLLDEKEEIADECIKSINSKKSHYLARKIELNEQQKELAVEYEKYKELKDKHKKFTNILGNYEKDIEISQNNTINANEQSLPEDNNVMIQQEQNSTENIQSEEQQVSQQVEEDASVQQSSDNNTQSQPVVQQEKTVRNTQSQSVPQQAVVQNTQPQSASQPVSVQNTQSQEIEQKEQDKDNDSKNNSDVNNKTLNNVRAKIHINKLLKMPTSDQAEYFSQNGYLKLNQALSDIKDNKEGCKISRADKKKLIESMESDIKKTCSKDEIKNDSNEILELLNRFGCKLQDFKGKELFDRLFIMDEEKSKLPAIANNLILSSDRRDLAFIIDEYRQAFEAGNLTQDEINKFEQYIVNPYSVSVIKNDLENMGFVAKIKNRFASNDNNKYYNLSARTLKELNVAKEIYNDKKMEDKLNLSDLEYTDNEIAKNINNVKAKNIDPKDVSRQNATR